MIAISTEYLTRRLGFDVHAIEPLIVSGSHHSRLYACESSIGDLILRVCEGWQGWWTAYFREKVDQSQWIDQAWAVSQAIEAGVPAPEIVFTDRTDRWTMSRRIPGVDIDPRYETWQRCPYDEQEFGTILKRLHSISPSGWGPIDDQGHALFDTWPEFLMRAGASAIETARRHGAVTDQLADALETRWVPRLAEVDCGQPALLHMEALGFANLLYDPETRKITGLVDFEDCIGGDPLLELLFMRFYFEHDDEGTYRRDSWLKQQHFDFGRFAAGYGSAEDDADRMSLYQPFPYLDKLRWIDPEGPGAVSYGNQLAECIRMAAF